MIYIKPEIEKIGRLSVNKLDEQFLYCHGSISIRVSPPNRNNISINSDFVRWSLDMPILINVEEKNDFFTDAERLGISCLRCDKTYALIKDTSHLLEITLLCSFKLIYEMVSDIRGHSQLLEFYNIRQYKDQKP